MLLVVYFLCLEHIEKMVIHSDDFCHSRQLLILINVLVANEVALRASALNGKQRDRGSSIHKNCKKKNKNQQHVL